MTIIETITWASSKLSKTSSSPELDSEVLLSFVLKRPKEFIWAYPGHQLSNRKASSYKLLIAKRLAYWPVAYLTSHKEFFGLDFRVTPGVLNPRPETELLVELAIQAINDKQLAIRNIIDVGTGSGNIIISLAKKLTEYGRLVYHTPKLYAVDSSKKAIAVARQNARRHEVSQKIKFLHGNLLDPYLQLTTYLPGRLAGNLPTLILANLPYLTAKQYRSNLDLKHEPKTALVGGTDGLKYYRELFQQIKQAGHSREACPRPRSGGRNPVWMPDQTQHDIILLLEHDPSQKQNLKSLARKFFDKAKVRFYKDLAGRNRVMEIIISRKQRRADQPLLSKYFLDSKQ